MFNEVKINNNVLHYFWLSTMNQPYKTLQVVRDRGVVWVTFEHGDINLLDQLMIKEIDQLSHELTAEQTCNVVVFQSNNPEFFIAHADVDLIRTLGEASERPKALNLYVAALERLRRLPMASIGKIAGIARGGGSEFLLSLDMRFAAIGPTILSQPEVALGIFPTGSGSQRLPRLLGRARALEVALGCEDFDAEQAERYGYINRAVPEAALDDLVASLAYRIASFPRHAIAATKRAMDFSDSNLTEGLLEEQHLFNQTRVLQESQRRMAKFLDEGAQTRVGELNLEKIIQKLGR